MSRPIGRQLPYSCWPEEDRNSWEAAFKGGDPFDDCGTAAHLAERTRLQLSYGYGRFLGFLKAQQPDSLGLPPADRPTLSIIIEYVGLLRQTCSERTAAGYLRTLRAVLRLISPARDWSW